MSYFHSVSDARKKYKNLLVVDAGDRFSGTLWFTQYGGAAAAKFVNKENYDVYVNFSQRSFILFKQ